MVFIMKTARKQQLHDNIRQEIKSIAWKQVTENSAASLSLGAIARQLGVTTPALYRYYPSRDDLVTALIQEAYVSFIETLEAARDGIPDDDHVGRFRSLYLAYHTWAVKNPQQYSLIFGNPVPGYQLDPQVSELADRSFQVLLEMIEKAVQAGRIHFSIEGLSPSDELRKALGSEPPHGKAYSAQVMYLALVSWSFMHGVTSLELSGRYPHLIKNTISEFIAMEMERFIQYIRLE
jgi:AcrR family transcriptional regulator